MAYFRVVILQIVILTGIIPIPVFAYDRQTHEGLTQAIVQGYEKLHGDAFNANEQRVITGSSAEDDDWRFLNHFYDPINYRGLTVLGVSLGQPSESWAHDTRGQASWKCVAYFSCSHDIEYNDKLFSSPTDFSWDRAVYEYVYGDKQRGLESLGHVLHFIEDATVPAHVRNDQHGHIGSVGDADPYETFTNQFTSANIPTPADLSNIPTYSTLSSYLDHVARFTNTHFVSKDTLFTSYTLPDSTKLEVRGDFLFDTTLNNRIAYTPASTDFHKHSKDFGYSVSDPEHLVVSDNWNILSKTAIENGIGVVDLFFREVEKEKKTGAIKAKNISAAEQNAKDLAKKGFKYVKALYGSSLEQSDVEELLGDNAGQAGAAALAVGNEPAPSPQNTVSTKPAVPTVSQTNPLRPQAAPRVPNPPVPPVEEPTEPESPEQNLTPPAPAAAEAETSVPSPSTSSSGGAGGGSPTATQGSDAPASGGSTPPAAPDPLSISILSPSENELFGTTTVTFTGTTSAAALVTAAYDSTLATTTTDGNGNWTFSLSLPSGATTVSFSAATSTETTVSTSSPQAATSTRTVVVDTSVPDAPDIEIDECASTLVVGSCVVATTTVTISWNIVSGVSYYGLTANDTLLATTTATSSTSVVSDMATTTFSVVAHKANGTAATSTEQTVFVTTQPVIINEIAWAGDNTSASNQWVELKNLSSYTINLSDVMIVRDGGASSIQLSGSILPNDYLVVEATEISFTGPYKLITPFDALSASGEELSLVWNAGTTIDATPPVVTCGGWCAGALNAVIGTSVGVTGDTISSLSMERIPDATDGTQSASWRSTDSYGSGKPARWGTPGATNSPGLPYSGVYCGSSGNLVVANTAFNPGSGSCVFLSRFISFPILNDANRFGGLYHGTVGSSTSLTGDGQALFLPAADISINFLTTNPVVGDSYFFTMFERPTGPAFDLLHLAFKDYFTNATLAPTPPLSHFVVIPFTYQP